MVKSGIRERVNLFPEIKKRLEGMGDRQVLVGIPVQEGAREDVPINNAQLGYLHEFGSPANNIPARPFLIPGVKIAARKVEPALADAVIGLLAGDEGQADRAMHKAGMIAASAVKMKIQTGPFAKLSESTLEARARRGVTRVNPLIDTGSLQGHITHVVK